MDGLKPPILTDLGKEVTGRLQNKLHQQNKQLRMLWQKLQKINTYWTKRMGTFFIPDDIPPLAMYKNKMRSKSLALHYPAAIFFRRVRKIWLPHTNWQTMAMDHTGDVGGGGKRSTPISNVA